MTIPLRTSERLGKFRDCMSDGKYNLTAKKTRDFASLKMEFSESRGSLRSLPERVSKAQEILMESKAATEQSGKENCILLLIPYS